MEVLALIALARTVQFYDNEELASDALLNDLNKLMQRSGPADKKKNPKVNPESRLIYQRGEMLAIRGIWSAAPVYRPRSVNPNALVALKVNGNDFNEFVENIQTRFEGTSYLSDVKAAIKNLKYLSIMERVRAMLLKAAREDEEIIINESEIKLKHPILPLEESLKIIKRVVVSDESLKAPVSSKSVPKSVANLLKLAGRKIEDS